MNFQLRCARRMVIPGGRPERRCLRASISRRSSWKERVSPPTVRAVVVPAWVKAYTEPKSAS